MCPDDVVTDEIERIDPMPADVERGGILLEDLLLDVRTLVALARRQADRAEWLDTLFLLAAITQVLDDGLHRSRTWTKRLTEHLERGHGRPGRAVAVATQRLSAVRRRLDETGRRHRELIDRRDRIVGITVRVAEAVLGRDEASGELGPAVAAVLGGTWSEDLDGVLTVPSCFRGFDQHPVDLVALAHDIAERQPDRSRPVTVFGVRTSGSYLGPLLAAALRAEGYAAEASALRPTDHLDHGQQAAVGRLGDRGLAVVVDDPPVSGGALADSADLVIACGIAPSQVLIAIGVDDPHGTVPSALVGRPVVVLPGERWHLASRFSAAAVRTTLQCLLGPGPTVAEVEAIGWPGPPHPEVAATARRRHRRGAYRVVLRHADGREQHRTLLVESVGPGLFGGHALAVARRLDGFVPDSIALVDGCHYQWLPDEVAPGAHLVPVDPASLTGYLVARHRALPVEVDRTLALEGRQSVWEVAAEVLSDALGPAGTVFRPRVVGPAVRRILAVPAPSIIDGRMDLAAFLLASERASAVKLAASEGAFSHRDLASYDPVFDVAAVADAPVGTAVRRGWEDVVGRHIEAERWLLLRLVHGWDRRRHGASSAATRDAARRALQDYLGEVALSGLPEPGPQAPVAALDVDGVLETYVLGTSAPGLDGILALRTLLAHGHRVVLATGRSAPDVAARLAAWNLPVGVAEYGAALVDGSSGVVTDLRSERARATMASVREAVAAIDGVRIDPEYDHVVRAYRQSAGGRTGLTDADLRRVRGALSEPDALTVVPGEDQTDLTPAACTKASGLSAALSSDVPPVAPGLGTRGGARLALAVGDGPADLGMLALAERAVLPRHARALARDAAREVVVARHAYQAGLAEAVAGLVGHEPGGCPTCALDLSPAARFVLATISLRAAGRAAIGPRLAAVATTAAAVSRAGR